MDIIQRFNKYKKIDESTGCWLWIGGKHKDGYGKIKYKGRTLKVHRVSASVYLGYDLYSELQVNHKPPCRNRACFNPEHLYIGTHAENAKDRKDSNLACSKGHPYSVNKPYINNGNRHCIVCRREATRRYRKDA